MPEQFIRPEITAEEATRIKMAAQKIVKVQRALDIAIALVALMGQNLKLTKEVNLHRAARGFELLP